MSEQRVYDAFVYAYHHVHLPVDSAWQEFNKEHPAPGPTETTADNVLQFDVDLNKWRQSNQ